MEEGPAYLQLHGPTDANQTNQIDNIQDFWVTLPFEEKKMFYIKLQSASIIQIH